MGNCLKTTREFGDRPVFESHLTQLKREIHEHRVKWEEAKAKENEELRKKGKKNKEVPTRVLPSRKCKDGERYITQTPVELPQPPKRNRTPKVRQIVSPSAPPASVYDNDDPTSV